MTLTATRRTHSSASDALSSAPRHKRPPSKRPQCQLLSVAAFAMMLVLAGLLPPPVPAQSQVDDQLSRDPYVVFVAHESAYTRCGPGSDHYRADPLRHGQELEVYVETADGWLGVRPPENSFCWLPASATEPIPNSDDATVIEDKSVVWIGTHLGRARQYQWQVQLSKGETVTIIGKSERDGPDGPQVWYRIVPPSGEFRWVHRDQIVASSEDLVANLQRIARKDVSQRNQNEADSSRATTYDRDLAELSTAEIQPASVNSDPDSFHPKVARSILSEDDSSRRVAAETDSDASALTIAETPLLAPAPMPSRAARRSDDVDIIGSGVQPQRSLDQDSASAAVTPSLNPLANVNLPAPVRDAVDAAARFVGQPRLLEIGGGNVSAPQPSEVASSANWIAASPRLPASLHPADSSGGVSQVAGISDPNPTRGVATQGQVRYVSPEAISRVEDAIRGADLDQLNLVFSRLMAEAASADELAPVAREVHRIMNGGDPALANRARELAQRVTRYQQIATRRDGSTVLRPTNSSLNLVPTPQVPSVYGNSQPSISPNQSVQLAGASTPSLVPGTPPSPEPVPSVGQATGYLVQVYSSRANSPPYALTDESGATLAYVTPYPGVNLRPHLNSEVSVRGNQGFLQGVNTPHVLVTEAMRTKRR